MSENVSRRRFLQAVGASGGAGALFATMGALGVAPTAAVPAPPWRAPNRSDFHLTGRAARRVVVLGGGIAGLTTAYELGKAGYDCTVLEARGIAGGRNLTIRGGSSETDLDGHTQRATFSPGEYFNPGPARIAQWMVTLDYCRELRVPVEVFANQNADTFIHRNGVLTKYRTAKADMYGYVSELLAKATDQGALDAELTAEDKERLLAFLEDFGSIGDRTAGWEYAGTSRRGFSRWPGAGNDAGTPLPGPPSLSDVLAGEVGFYFSFEFGYDQAMPMFQPVGGMDRIAHALGRAVGPQRITLGAEVTNITDTPGGVEVVYRQGGWTRRLTADFCVATLPPNILARVPHNLGADITAALRMFGTVHAGKLGLEYKRRWWEQDLRILGGATETDLDIGRIWYPSSGYLGDRGVVVGYYNLGPDADTYGALPPAGRITRAVEQGVKIHGEVYRTQLRSGFSVAWHRMPHLESAWAAPPYGTSAYDLLLRPAGKVYFAGDWLSHAVAWQHGAFVSARAAVSALHERVMSS